MAVKLAFAAGAAFAVAACIHQMPAQAQTFVGSYTDTGNGNVNTAKALFTLVTGTTTYLEVTLTNTSTFTGGYNNPDALSGLFFEIAGNPTLNLTSSSVISALPLINASSCATSYVTTCGSANVPLGAEWRYEYSGSGFTATGFAGSAAHFGVAASQYSGLTPSFGKNSAANIGASQPSLAASGTGQLGFSLVGANYSGTTAANSMKGLPLANTSLKFDFALPAGITSVSISNVYFTYGTAPDGSAGATVASPEPRSVMLLTMATLSLGAIHRRRKRLASMSPS